MCLIYLFVIVVLFESGEYFFVTKTYCNVPTVNVCKIKIFVFNKNVKNKKYNCFICGNVLNKLHCLICLKYLINILFAIMGEGYVSSRIYALGRSESLSTTEFNLNEKDIKHNALTI